MVPSLSLLSCELSVSVKENPDRKKNDDCENIYRVNPLYLIIAKAFGHIEENNENKYLVFDSKDENKEV